MDLIFYDYRIDDCFEIINGDECSNFQFICFWVDFDFVNMIFCWEGEVGWIVKIVFFEVGFDFISWKFVCGVSSQCNFVECQGFVVIFVQEEFVFKIDRICGNFYQMSGNLFFFCDDFVVSYGNC